MPLNNLAMKDLGNNMKGISWDSWGGIDNFLRETSTGAGGTAKPQLLRRVMPWLAKANDMTALAVSQLPFDITRPDGSIFDTSSDWQDKLGAMADPDKLFYKLASSLCLGKAYIIPEYTNRMLVDLHYCAPHTVVPLITTNGLQQFSRTSDWGQSGTYAPLGKFEEVPAGFTGEMMYFWLSDADVEIGPAKSFPAGAAQLASELITSIDATLQAISERGFVPPTLLSVKGMISQSEREKTENWYNRFLRRWTDTVAKIINADTMDIKTIGAGMADLKGIYSELKKQAIEDVGTAHGIPAALFMSDMAFATEVNPMIRIWYSTSTFVKIYHTIESTFNEQLLSKFDLKMRFKPETLDAFQANEESRSRNYATYRTAGIKPSIAAQMVGLEMPEGVEFEMLDDEPQPGKLEPTAQQDAAGAALAESSNSSVTNPVKQIIDANQIKELALWQQVATRNPEKAASFKCVHLNEDIAYPIRERLRVARTELEIVKSFSIDINSSMSDIKYLADAINKSAEAQPSKPESENMQIIIDTNGNAIKAQANDSAKILEAIKALVQMNSVKTDVIIPAPQVTVNVPVRDL